MDTSVLQPVVGGFFKPLLPNSASHELSCSADKPMDFTTVSEHTTFEQIRTSVERMSISPGCEALEGGQERISPLSPIENFRSPSLSPVEDRGSFYQLTPDYGLLENTLGITPPIKEDVVSREEDLCFVELPVASADPKHEAVPETVIMSEDRGMDHFHSALYPVGEHNSLQPETQLHSAQEASSEIPASPVQDSVCQSGCAPATLQRSPSRATHVKSFDSCFLKSDISVWVSEPRTKGGT